MRLFKHQTKKIHIIEDDSTPSFQQTLLLDQKKQVIEMIHGANQHLDTKVVAVLQAAAVAISLVSILAVPGFISDKPALIDKWLIASSFAAFAVLLIATLVATWPRAYVLPGTQDWDLMWYLYQNKEPDGCYHQILRDYANSITKLRSINDYKAKALVAVTILLVIQIGLLVAMVIF